METVKRESTPITMNGFFLGKDSSVLVIAEASIKFALQYPRESLTRYQATLASVEEAYFWIKE